MNANGSNPQQRSSQPISENPAWSPDGSKIAYDADGNGDGWQEIWLMDAGGGNQRPVYDPPESNTDAWAHSWSPDGRYVAFTRISWVVKVASGTGPLPTWTHGIAPIRKHHTSEQHGKGLASRLAVAGLAGANIADATAPCPIAKPVHRALVRLGCWPGRPGQLRCPGQGWGGRGLDKLAHGDHGHIGVVFRRWRAHLHLPRPPGTTPVTSRCGR